VSVDSTMVGIISMKYDALLIMYNRLFYLMLVDALLVPFKSSVSSLCAFTFTCFSLSSYIVLPSLLFTPSFPFILISCLYPLLPHPYHLFPLSLPAGWCAQSRASRGVQHGIRAGGPNARGSLHQSR
jgi:hypothetical protein